MDGYGKCRDLSVKLLVGAMTSTSFNSAARLSYADHQLDRINSFIPRINAKASVLLALASAELAVMVLNLAPADLMRWYIGVPVIVFLGLISGVLIQLYRCAYPHLKGGNSSLIYFGEIAKRTEANYLREYTALTEDDLLRELVGQIWRNSEIVSAKYSHLKLATVLTMTSLVPWVVVLGTTAVIYSRLPVTH